MGFLCLDRLSVCPFFLIIVSLFFSYPNLRCCPDSIWDDEENKCVGEYVLQDKLDDET